MDNYIPRPECDACKSIYDAKIDAIDDRLSNVETDVKQVHALAISVEKMAGSLEHMAKELEKQGKRLEAMESQPAENWKKLIWIVIAGVVGAVLAHLMTHFGL